VTEQGGVARRRVGVPRPGQRLVFSKDLPRPVDAPSLTRRCVKAKLGERDFDLCSPPERVDTGSHPPYRIPGIILLRRVVGRDAIPANSRRIDGEMEGRPVVVIGIYGNRELITRRCRVTATQPRDDAVGAGAAADGGSIDVAFGDCFANAGAGKATVQTRQRARSWWCIVQSAIPKCPTRLRGA
jgi:hypothetical protein